MSELTPVFLLNHPALFREVAPWCRRLQNLELGILLLTQPWLSSDGLRRSDLERQLAMMSSELPLGPIYFQRVSRAVRGLEEDGAVDGVGSGRRRRFVSAPQGFVSLVLNLRVFFDDPTLEGSEMELKRALVSSWGGLLERLLELPADPGFDDSVEAFFAAVEEVTIWDRQVITEETIGLALNIQQLIADARSHVSVLRKEAAERLEAYSRRVQELQHLDLSLLVDDGVPGAGAILRADPEARAVLQTLVTRLLPEHTSSAVLLRYDSYLSYLDELALLYSRELRVVNLGLFRRAGEPHREG